MSRDLVLTFDCDQSEQSRGEEEERDVSRRTVSLRLRHSQSRTSLGCGLVMCIWVTSLWSGALLHVVRSHTSLTSHHQYFFSSHSHHWLRETGDCFEKNSRLWLSRPLISAANSSRILFWTVSYYDYLHRPFYQQHNHQDGGNINCGLRPSVDMWCGII